MMKERSTIAVFRNESIAEILRAQGWSGSGRGDRSAIEEKLIREGYPVFEAVVSFLEYFGGWTIRFPNLKNTIENDDINFDFHHASSLEVPEKVTEAYASRIGKKLCLIGTAYRDHFVLMMAEDGAVYGGSDDFLCHIADSGNEAIEAIMLDKAFREV